MAAPKTSLQSSLRNGLTEVYSGSQPHLSSHQQYVWQEPIYAYNNWKAKQFIQAMENETGHW